MHGWRGILWTLGLVFGVAMLVQFSASVTNVWDLDVSTAKQILNSGAMAVVAFLVNYFAPFIDRYGLGAKSDK